MSNKRLQILLKASPPAMALLEDWVSNYASDTSIKNSDSNEEAIAMIAEFQFDLALVDLGNDPETGIRFLTVVSAMLPCVAIGNTGDLEIAAQAWQSGAVKWLQWSPDRNAVASPGSDLLAVVDSVCATARLKAEIEVFKEQLVRATRMKTTARMARVIAHEYNNALSGITGNLSLLEMVLPDSEKVHKYGNRMLSSVKRLTELSNRLSTYAKGKLYEPEKIHPNRFVENMLPAFRRIGWADCEIVFRPDEGAPAFMADGMQFELALKEVFRNAITLIRGKIGPVTIETAQRVVPAAEVGLGDSRSPGNYTCFMIRHESPGIDSKAITRLFIPSFSTASLEGHLGLASAAQILKAHGGWIDINSDESKGLAFEICLPSIASEG